MRPLSRAIHGIPRPYLCDRREGLIFRVRGWNALPRQWILPGRAGRCRALESGPCLLAGLLRIAERYTYPRSASVVIHARRGGLASCWDRNGRAVNDERGYFSWQ